MRTEVQQPRPKGELECWESSKYIDRQISFGSDYRKEDSRSMSNDNIAPQVITRILREVRDLSRKPPDGIMYVDNTENSVKEIHAIITGPGEWQHLYSLVLWGF